MYGGVSVRWRHPLRRRWRWRRRPWLVSWLAGGTRPVTFAALGEMSGYSGLSDNGDDDSALATGDGGGGVALGLGGGGVLPKPLPPSDIITWRP